MKVLIINPEITNYRVGVYDLIGKEIDLTVLHFGKFFNSIDLSFHQVVSTQIKIGPFFLSRINLNKICSKYDIIISDGNLRYLDRNLLIINPFRSYKWINWGIGLSASLDKKIGADTSLDFLRFAIFRKADANVFYSDFPIDKYLRNGFKKQSLFVAWNTVVNNQIDYSIEELIVKKDSIIFVGTLYKQKGVLELLDVYKDYLNVSKVNLKLHIVGGGDEYESIKSYISKYNLNNVIILHGPIYDNKKLNELYKQSYVCISPNQAGLSVLTSMSFGVPFVTKPTAITGGEIFSIEHTVNGYLYRSNSELLELLLDIERNPSTYINMGIYARKFYLNQRSPRNLVATIIQSCNYVIKSGQE